MCMTLADLHLYILICWDHTPRYDKYMGLLAHRCEPVVFKEKMSSICTLNCKGKKMEAVLVCQQQYFISVLEKQKRLLWNLFLRSHMDCLKVLAKYVSKYTPKFPECEVILRKIEDICTFLDKIINFISIFSNININHMSLT